MPDINRLGPTQNDRIAASGQNQVAKTLDIYDSEMLKIEEVLQAIQARRGSKQRQDLGDFDLFIRESFHKIGFIVDVKWYESNIPDVKIPDIEIVGRVDEHFVFDRDRRRYLAAHRLLRGLLASRWEDAAAVEGRPRRRLYELTGEGARVAETARAGADAYRPRVAAEPA